MRQMVVVLMMRIEGEVWLKISRLHGGVRMERSNRAWLINCVRNEMKLIERNI